ncbi:hypothetical protein QFZ56_002628 [Streptomyces achromogenes]|uniref:Trypsin-co-occurring domain-containing protein n=1 Tax=Streptomyces achromogenes TaxID=67255 RepID=A0ABU0PZ30_STRAH|nr:trypco2 family protein [Streptomyces achromogenes]MDQ0683665.1 hypothetical protein [Streptomyces achromogenes]
MNEKTLSLSEIITAVVNDLYTAEQTRFTSGRAGRIGVDSVELELKATTSKEGGGGIRFNILSANYTGKAESVSTIKVKLSPLDEHQGDQFMFSEDTKTGSATSEWLFSVQSEAALTQIDTLIAAARQGDISNDQLLRNLQEIRRHFEPPSENPDSG